MRNTRTISRHVLLAGSGTLPLVFSIAGRGRAEILPLVTVIRDLSCGCWAEHIEAGFSARVIESEGYVIKDHVPATALRRLMAGRPVATGLAVPGTPGSEPELYDVILFRPSGRKAFPQFLGGREA